VAPGAPISYLGPLAEYKFDRLQLSSLLPVGNSVPVEVIGEVTDVTWFAGVDYIRVLKPKMTASTLPAYGSEINPELMVGTTISLAWEDQEGYPAASYDLWYSSDAGVTWAPIVAGLTVRSYDWRVPDEATEDGLIELVANDDLGEMGSWVSTVFSVLYGTTDADPGIPTRFDLSFASSNPARGRARFELSLPVTSEVDAGIYDVRGRLVTSLARGSREAGRHVLEWNGTGTAGSGVYFLKTHAGPLSKTVRFVLLK
jgi:hypothetical protein